MSNVRRAVQDFKRGMGPRKNGGSWEDMPEAVGGAKMISMMSKEVEGD